MMCGDDLLCSQIILHSGEPEYVMIQTNRKHKHRIGLLQWQEKALVF